MAVADTRARVARVSADESTPDIRPTGRTIVGNVAWLTGAQLGAGLAQFAAIVMLVRHLGPGTYGHWGFALAYVNVFAALADFGLSTLAVSDLVQRRGIAGAYLGTAAVLKAALSAVVFALMVALAQAVAADPETRLLVYLLGMQMLAASALMLLNAVYRSRERMDVEAAIRVGQALCTLAVVALLVRHGANAPEIALGYLGVTVGALACSLTIARGGFLPPDLSVRLSMMREMLIEAAPLGGGMIMTSAYYYFDTLYMGWLGQERQVGWYTAAYVPVLWIAQIVGVVRAAFLPGQARAAGDESNARSFLGSYARFSLVLALPVAVSGTILARPALQMVYGADYAPATFALQLLSCTAALMFCSSLFGAQLLVGGRQRTYLLGVTLGALVNVVLNVVLIPRFSLSGAAAATLAAETVVAGFMLGANRMLFPVRAMVASLQSPVLAAALLGATLLIAMTVSGPIAAGICGLTVYAFAAWRLGWPAAAPRD